MKHRRPLSLAVLLILLSVTTGSCSARSPSDKDRGLLSGDPCAPPCFEGVTPGESHQADVEALLTRTGVLDTCEYIPQPDDQRQEELAVAGFLCEGFTTFAFDVQSATLVQLAFQPSRGVTTGEFIRVHGQPSGVFVWVEGSPDQPLVGMELYFEKLATILHVNMTDGVTFNLRESTDITRVVYASDAFFENAVNSDPRAGLQPWRGYGLYEPSVDFRP
jgi:hypothetical protein